MRHRERSKRQLILRGGRNQFRRRRDEALEVRDAQVLQEKFAFRDPRMGIDYQLRAIDS